MRTGQGCGLFSPFEKTLKPFSLTFPNEMAESRRLNENRGKELHRSRNGATRDNGEENFLLQNETARSQIGGFWNSFQIWKVIH